MQHFDSYPPCKINNRNFEAHKQLILAQIGFLAYFDVTKKVHGFDIPLHLCATIEGTRADTGNTLIRL